jgi:CheY-like chemotaxis protein
VDPNGLLLSDDLIFTSRIVGTARDLGLTMRAYKTSAELLERVRQETPACVLVDLANRSLAIAELMEELREIGARVIAYGPHVDAAALRAAREAGCDLVLPRSRFVEELPARLAEWFQPRT